MPFEIAVVFDDVEAYIVGLRQRVERTVSQAADDVVEEAKRELAAPKSGHVYTRHGEAHQASAPGEAPASDSGGLAESIKVTGEDHYNKQIEVNHPAALALEFGRADGHFAARPYMAPAAETVKPKFIGMMEQAGKKGATG